MLYKITNALGRPASEQQMDAINLNCNHLDVWRLHSAELGSNLFEVDSESGAADLKKIALEFGLFASTN